MRFSHGLLTVAVVAPLMVGYGSWQTSAADLLWIPAEATLEVDAAHPVAFRAGRSVYKDGSAAVGFTVTDEREAVTTQVINQYARLGWHQRSRQYLNPRLTTSFSAGWQQQCACILTTDAEGKPIPRPELYQWTGEWENEHRDVIRYSFIAEGVRVRGYGSYVPAKIVGASMRTD